MRRRYRSLLALALLALVGALLVGRLAATAQLAALETRAIQRVRSGAAIVASRLTPAAEAPAALQRLAQEQAALLGGRVTLIDLDGRVAADSALSVHGVAAMDDHRRRPEIVQAALAGVGEFVRRSSTTSLEYLYGARRVDDDAAVRYARMAIPWSPVRQAARRHGLVVGGWSWLATMFVGGAIYLGLRRRERAVQRFADSITNAVDHATPLASDAANSPYLGGLGAAVGALQKAQESRFREVESDRALLDSVISGMRDGLLLVDSGRRVRLANAALRTNLAVDFDPQGRLVTDAVRHPAVIEEIDAAFARGGERSDSVIRVASTGQAFRLHTVTLERDGASGREVLVLFFDITRLEQLERVRREFVANVSHELRTPLTSIKAFVEMLIDAGLDDRDEARRFLGIVRKHTDRMSELIEDLTDLSLIETGAIRLELESLDVGAVTADVVVHLAPQIDRRELSVRVEIPTTCRVDADRRRLEQVLMNLIDNAIKFSRPGGTIVIAGETNPDRTLLRVRDEGIGIAADALERIFHRFHRERRDGVDEARGTGLGLAIVKHLMRLHGGAVRVESELGQGAEFVAEFPARSAEPD